MGFQFSETMSGTVEWHNEPGKRHPFRFDVTAHADSTRDHLATGLATLRGTVFAPPITRSGAAHGTITIRPVGQKIIRYELAFVGDDGKHYEIVGQKDIRWLKPLSTFTDLPAEIHEIDGNDHRAIGTCQTAFDLRRDWWKFLRSFRPA